jgi:FKBP-type peptidyl-prolyl cis-trans isomerase FklB
MRIGFLPVLTAGLSLALLQTPARAEDAPAFKNSKEKASYGIGMVLASQITNAIVRSSIDADNDMILAGVKDVLEGHPTRLAAPQVQQIIMSYITEKNHAIGDAFLAENKKKDGVKILPVTLANGSVAELQYKVLAEGSGPSPKSNDVVTVNYKGRLINGTEFDSSEHHGPLHRPANQLIRGWTEALQHMKVGAKWELYVPSALAYGDKAAGQAIQAGSTLIFEMELLGFEPPSAATATAGPATAAHVSTQAQTSDIIKVPGAEELKKGAKIEVIKPEDVSKYTSTNKP